MNTLETPWGTTLYYKGAPLEAGPMPALFYFSIAGDESLELPPFCNPVTFLEDAPLRIFSLTLPSHGPGFDKHKAMAYWAEQMTRGETPLEDGIDDICRCIDHLFEENIATTVATAGLSRGALFATHAAARDSRVIAVCGFAPWVDPSLSPGYPPESERLALKTLVDKLTHTHIRFYVGNRDMAVGTDNCFTFINDLANRAFDEGIRSPHAELIVSPSIGHRGHGTPEHIFKVGADWLREKLS